MALSIVGIAIFAIFAAKLMSIIGRRAGFIFWHQLEVPCHLCWQLTQ